MQTRGESGELPLNVDRQINANGSVHTIRFTSVADGNLTGTIDGSPIFGFWDATSQKVQFMRFGSTNNITQVQVYTGYLITRVSTSAGSKEHFLAGSFEAFTGTGASGSRSVFGWFASLQ